MRRRRIYKSNATLSSINLTAGEFREGDRDSGGGSNKIIYLTYPP